MSSMLRRTAKNTIRTALIMAAAAVATVTHPSSAAQAADPYYVGLGRVANVTALGLSALDVFNTGNLPVIGGLLDTGSLPLDVTVGIPPVTFAVIAKADVSFASTTGSSGAVTSTAALSAVSLLSLEALGATILAPTVSVGALTSFAYADANGSYGYSKIADLRVGAQVVNFDTITVNGEVYAAPNQTLNVLGVELVINEQKRDANGVLSVNALRVKANPVGIGLADISLGTTQAGLITVVPEPGTLALLSLGSAGTMGVLVRKRKA